MDKNTRKEKNRLKRIGSIFLILVQYEKIGIDSSVTEETYVKYLERLYVKFTGYGNEDIIYSIKGLMILGKQATYSMVRTTVFHMIETLSKEVLK